MPILLIADQVVDLPMRWAVGEPMSEELWEIVNAEYMKRLSAQIRWRYNRKEITKENIQAEALRMAENFVFHKNNEVMDEDDENDPIMVEAIKIAKELIIQELASAGLADVPNIDQHARAVVEGNPAIREKAFERVKIRIQLAQRAVQELGA